MAGVTVPEALQIRIHGAPHLPTLVYLPGLHGDWTLVGDFRRQLAGHVRFVEFTYPRTRTWSLDEYAVAIENLLAQNGITRGWLLGESYGSQILWTLVARHTFSAPGIILAGGFARHPLQWGVRLVRKIFGRLPFKLLIWLLFTYSKLARLRYRRAPETLASIDDFVTRRTEPDRQAALHRLDQIANFDAREIARTTQLPVFYLSGWFDPIVPWHPVRKWLRQNCPNWRGDKIIFRADHNILATAAGPAARQVLAWLKS
jgi:pimeloyl-ACP methyl ester carboxylesterase